MITSSNILKHRFELEVSSNTVNFWYILRASSINLQKVVPVNVITYILEMAVLVYVMTLFPAPQSLPLSWTRAELLLSETLLLLSSCKVIIFSNTETLKQIGVTLEWKASHWGYNFWTSPYKQAPHNALYLAHK